MLIFILPFLNLNYRAFTYRSVPLQLCRKKSPALKASLLEVVVLCSDQHHRLIRDVDPPPLEFSQCQLHYSIVRNLAAPSGHSPAATDFYRNLYAKWSASDRNLSTRQLHYADY
jgi:hypothetical protein